MPISQKDIRNATERIFSRSSGPGGQNVNKTSTRVQLTFDILGSSLSLEEQKRLLKKHPSGFIRVVNQDTRSQLRNSQEAYVYLTQLIHSALIPEKKRKKVMAPHLTSQGKLKAKRKDKLLKYKKRYLND